MRLAVGSRTDIGRARKRNEDSLLVRAPLFAVADGMGGARGGNVASAMSVEVLGGAPIDAEGTPAVIEAIHEANRAVLERSEAERDLHGMGTTITAFYVEGDKGHVAHIGDSRAYLLRDGHLQQLTEDHTVVQELVRQGRLSPQDAVHHPQRSILMRAVGVEEDIDVDELTLDLHVLDRILVCSDGLNAMLSDDGIALVLDTTFDPQDAADRLVALANEAGGNDNITVIVVDVLADDAEGTLVRAPAVHDGSGDPTETASMPAITVEPPAARGAAEVDADTDVATVEEAGEDVAAIARRGRARRRRVVAGSLVAILVLSAFGAFFGVRAFLNDQWYVGSSGDRVAVYQGIPASILGVRLARVADVTPLSAEEATRLQGWRTLPQGITAKSEVEADAIVERIRQDLCRSPSSTCVPTPLTPTGAP
jgi:serine/threonine protein phosphatase PrpC